MLNLVMSILGVILNLWLMLQFYARGNNFWVVSLIGLVCGVLGVIGFVVQRSLENENNN